MQLYEAAGELVIFSRPARAAPARSQAPGRAAARLPRLYALLRFVVEIFRGDVVRGLVFALDTPRLAGWLRLPAHEPVFLSVGQLASLIVLALCAVAWVRARRKPAR